MASKRDWIAVSDEVFVDPELHGFNWIRWSPGVQTKESFSGYPPEINPRLPGYPSHYMKAKHEIAQELKKYWLPSYLAQ